MLQDYKQPSSFAFPDRLHRQVSTLEDGLELESNHYIGSQPRPRLVSPEETQIFRELYRRVVDLCRCPRGQVTLHQLLRFTDPHMAPNDMEAHKGNIMHPDFRAPQDSRQSILGYTAIPAPVTRADDGRPNTIGQDVHEGRARERSTSPAP